MAKTALRLGIKSWFAMWVLAQVTPFWACCLLFNNSHEHEEQRFLQKHVLDARYKHPPENEWPRNPWRRKRWEQGLGSLRTLPLLQSLPLAHLGFLPSWLTRPCTGCSRPRALYKGRDRTEPGRKMRGLMWSMLRWEEDIAGQFFTLCRERN